MARLNATQVKAISRSGRHGDGDGLYLLVKQTGAKSWVQRIVVDGRRRDVGLGGYPAVTLAKARELAAANRATVSDGKDPLLERRKKSIPTFREAAIKVHAANLPRWRNGKHTDSWLQTLEKHAFPILGDMPVDRIEPGHVLNVLEPIWGVRQETARRVRQRIRTVLKWCMHHDFVKVNAAGEVIDGALPPMPRLKNHFRSLPYREVADALATIDESQASIAAKLCLRFLILTAARSGEARGATWDEIDTNEKLWTVPAARMKGYADHRVPLSEAALNVLGKAREIRDESNFVFPSPTRRGSQLSDMTLTKVLRSTGLAERATVHGFRGSFRTWAQERSKAPRAAKELALAHRIGDDVEESYIHTDMLDERIPLMDEWAEFLGLSIH